MAEEQKNRSVQRNQIIEKTLKEIHSTNIYRVGHALIIDEEIEEEVRQAEVIREYKGKSLNL